MKNNIPRFYSYSVFVALSFAFVPIFVLFMHSRGLSYAEIGIVQAIYYALFFVFEVPTGVIADKLGRKNTLLLGMLLKVIALVVSLFSYSFLVFVLAEIFFSLSRSFSSGADSAFVYDSLALSQDTSQYLHVEGKIQTVLLMAHVVGGLLGALMATVSLEAVYFFAAVMAILGFFSALRLTEPQVSHHATSSISGYRQHLLSSLRDVWGNSKMIWLILYSTLIFILLRASIISFFQPLLISLSFPENTFSLIDAMLALGAAGFSWYAFRMEKHLGIKRILLLLPIFMIVTFVGIALTMSPLSLAFYLMSALVWGLHFPVFRNYLNAQIPQNNKRATILSVESLVSRGGFSILLIPLGYSLEFLGVPQTLLFMSGFGILAMIVLLGFRRRAFGED
ncbi:MAG: MFS transporter [bacterium]|nr:MFS transporter [bacterium]